MVEVEGEEEREGEAVEEGGEEGAEEVAAPAEDGDEDWENWDSHASRSSSIAPAADCRATDRVPSSVSYAHCSPRWSCLCSRALCAASSPSPAAPPAIAGIAGDADGSCTATATASGSRPAGMNSVWCSWM